MSSEKAIQDTMHILLAGLLRDLLCGVMHRPAIGQRAPRLVSRIYKYIKKCNNGMGCRWSEVQILSPRPIIILPVQQVGCTFLILPQVLSLHLAGLLREQMQVFYGLVILEAVLRTGAPCSRCAKHLFGTNSKWFQRIQLFRSMPRYSQLC